MSYFHDTTCIFLMMQSCFPDFSTTAIVTSFYDPYADIFYTSATHKISISATYSGRIHLYNCYMLSHMFYGFCLLLIF